MSSLSLEIVLSSRAPALDVWRPLGSALASLSGESAWCEVDGRRCTVATAEDAIRASGRDSFVVESAGAQISYGHAGAYGLSLVHVEGCISREADAEVWVGPFIGMLSFRQARLYDHEYDFWQNAEDPLEYEGSGRKVEHLPMRSNGLPPPLEQRVIDTSRNPGRRVLREGFVEAVGAVVWLGPSFWPATGAKKDALCAQGWLHCDALQAGVLRITAAEQAFTSLDTGAVQEGLRALLFPTQNAQPSRP